MSFLDVTRDVAFRETFITNWTELPWSLSMNHSRLMVLGLLVDPVMLDLNMLMPIPVDLLAWTARP